MARILGYDSSADLLGAREDEPLRPFSDAEEQERLLGALLEHGVVANLQVRMSRKDGSLVWVEISAHTRSDPKRSTTVIEGVLSDITDRKRMLEELRQLATIDSLTGLYNRRHFLELCERELHRTRRYRLDVGLLMVDVDHFKTVNDTHGHDIGDQVLRLIARLCRDNLREADVLGRLGGEEFAALLPHASLREAGEVAERLRGAIAETAFPLPDGQMLRFTISIGACAVAAETGTTGDLLKAADRALYIAKRDGRNRVMCCGGDLSEKIDHGSPA